MTGEPGRSRSEIVAELRACDSCAISDALDTLGLGGAVTALHPLWAAQQVVAGRVRTVTAAPRSDAGPATHIATPLVETTEPDDVVVIDNHGRTDVSCWGGLLTVAALAHGVRGVIVDGAARDVTECAQLGLPVFARNVVPVSARGRVVQQAMDERVQVCGVSVASGDYVIADANGTVFVAAADIDRVLDLARRIIDRETHMAQAVRDGRSVSEVMHDSQFPTITAE